MDDNEQNQDLNASLLTPSVVLFPPLWILVKFEGEKMEKQYVPNEFSP